MFAPQDFHLTVEQEFAMLGYVAAAEHLTKEEARALLLAVVRQGLVKDNLMRKLMRTKL